VVRAVIERPDGTFAGPSNPLGAGKPSPFVTGLGPVSPQIPTKLAAHLEHAVVRYGQVVLSRQQRGRAGDVGELSPDIIGVYYIQFPGA